MIQIRPKRIGADDGMNETRSVQTILTETWNEYDVKLGWKKQLTKQNLHAIIR